MKIIQDINFLYSVNEDGEMIIRNQLEVLRVSEFEFCSFDIFLDGYKKALNSGADFLPIQIDSYGGEIYSLNGMLAYVQDWQASGKKVVTFTPSKAMSCGAVLLSAGSRGFRYMSKNAYVMVHEASNMEWGKAADLKNTSRHTDKLNQELFKLLDSNAGKEPGYFEALCKENKNADLFLSAEECLKHGLVDKIGIPTIEMRVKPTYNFIDVETPRKNDDNRLPFEGRDNKV